MRGVMMKKLHRGVIGRALSFTVLAVACTATGFPLLGQELYDVEPRLVFDALRLAYGGLVEDIGWEGEDAYFVIRGERIFFSGGRMLYEAHLSEAERYDPILYRYEQGPLTGILESVPYPVNRSNDFFEALIGRSEAQIVSSCRWVDFLDHRVFMHEICTGSLERIDNALRQRAESSSEVRAYIDDIKIVFSLDRRQVHGTGHLSVHAFGIALDIVPRDYGGKQVYWRWSRAWNENWEKMGLAERWAPPDQVIEVFEQEGFIWGGKWYHFDTIHFEYRPEIIMLNRLRDREAAVRE
jgi:hypothetical protein